MLLSKKKSTWLRPMAPDRNIGDYTKAFTGYAKLGANGIFTCTKPTVALDTPDANQIGVFMSTDLPPVSRSQPPVLTIF